MRSAAAAAAFVLVTLFAGWALTAPAGARYDPNDEWQGLPKGKGREAVFYNCVACHSMAIIQQQRLNRRVWSEVLQWMIDEVRMPKPSDQDYQLILDYLVEHFGQDVPR
jgi:cytochrome c